MRDAWRKVLRDGHGLTWPLVVGNLGETDYLTPLGISTGLRAATDLDSFSGKDWLDKVTAPGSEPGIDPTGYWTALNKAQPVYLALLSLWASIQVLVESKTPGIGTVRDIFSNPRAGSVRHAVLQMRVAATALGSGCEARLEPRTGSGKGDLLVTRAGTEVLIEFRGLGLDNDSKGQERLFRQLTGELLLIEASYDVHWSGELPDEPPPDWRALVETAAAACAATSEPQRLDLGGSVLTVSPGAARSGTRLRSRRHETDQESRLLRALALKAKQTAAAGAAWVWLEDDGALWPMTPFAEMPLDQKVRTLARELDEIFTRFPHLIGVVVTSGTRRWTGPADSEVETPEGIGMTRVLPDGRVRESVLVHRRLIVPDQVRLVRSLVADEPSMLDEALVRLGVAGGLPSLVATPRGTQAL